MKEKRMTRERFEKKFSLQGMRRKDPIQFEVLFVQFCREHSYEYYSK